MVAEDCVVHSHDSGKGRSSSSAAQQARQRDQAGRHLLAHPFVSDVMSLYAEDNPNSNSSEASSAHLPPNRSTSGVAVSSSSSSSFSEKSGTPAPSSIWKQLVESVKTRLEDVEKSEGSGGSGRRLKEWRSLGQGVRCLFGVPGSGRTTTLLAEAIAAVRKGQRVTAIFPSQSLTSAAIELLAPDADAVVLLRGRAAGESKECGKPSPLASLIRKKERCTIGSDALEELVEVCKTLFSLLTKVVQLLDTSAESKKAQSLQGGNNARDILKTLTQAQKELYEMIVTRFGATPLGRSPAEVYKAWRADPLPQLMRAQNAAGPFHGHSALLQCGVLQSLYVLVCDLEVCSYRMHGDVNATEIAAFARGALDDLPASTPPPSAPEKADASWYPLLGKIQPLLGRLQPLLASLICFSPEELLLALLWDKKVTLVDASATPLPTAALTAILSSDLIVCDDSDFVSRASMAEILTASVPSLRKGGCVMLSGSLPLARGSFCVCQTRNCDGIPVNFHFLHETYTVTPSLWRELCKMKRIVGRGARRAERRIRKSLKGRKGGESDPLEAPGGEAPILRLPPPPPLQLVTTVLVPRLVGVQAHGKPQMNLFECALLERLVRFFARPYLSQIGLAASPSVSFFVIAFRPTQAVLIQSIVKKVRWPKDFRASVEAGEPESFLGRHADVVILSLGCSGSNACVGCIHYEPRAFNRFCLALGRARKGLVFVGHFPDFISRHPHLGIPLGKVIGRVPSQGVHAAEVDENLSDECCSLMNQHRVNAFDDLVALVTQKASIRALNVLLKETPALKTLQALNSLIWHLDRSDPQHANLPRDLLPTVECLRTRKIIYPDVSIFVHAPRSPLSPSNAKKATVASDKVLDVQRSALAKHVVGGLAKIFCSSALRQTWRLCLLLCRGFTVTQVADAFEATDGTHRDFSVRVKHLARSDIQFWRDLQDLLTPDRVPNPPSTTAASGPMMGTHYAWVKTKEKAASRELVVLVLPDSYQSQCDVLELLALSAALEPIRPDRAIFLNCFSGSAPSWDIRKPNELLDDARFLRSGLLLFQKTPSIIFLEEDPDTAGRLDALLRAVNIPIKRRTLMGVSTEAGVDALMKGRDWASPLIAKESDSEDALSDYSSPQAPVSRADSHGDEKAPPARLPSLRTNSEVDSAASYVRHGSSRSRRRKRGDFERRRRVSSLSSPESAAAEGRERRRYHGQKRRNSGDSDSLFSVREQGRSKARESSWQRDDRDRRTADFSTSVPSSRHPSEQLPPRDGVALQKSHRSDRSPRRSLERGRHSRERAGRRRRSSPSPSDSRPSHKEGPRLAYRNHERRRPAYQSTGSDDVDPPPAPPPRAARAAPGRERDHRSHSRRRSSNDLPPPSAREPQSSQQQLHFPPASTKPIRQIIRVVSDKQPHPTPSSALPPSAAPTTNPPLSRVASVPTPAFRDQKAFSPLLQDKLAFAKRAAAQPHAPIPNQRPPGQRPPSSGQMTVTLGKTVNTFASTRPPTSSSLATRPVSQLPAVKSAPAMALKPAWMTEGITLEIDAVKLGREAEMRAKESNKEKEKDVFVDVNAVRAANMGLVAGRGAGAARRGKRAFPSSRPPFF